MHLLPTWLTRDRVRIALERDQVAIAWGNESLVLEPTLFVDASTVLPRDGIRLIVGTGSNPPVHESAIRVRLFHHDEVPPDVDEHKVDYLERFFRFVLELQIQNRVLRAKPHLEVQVADEVVSYSAGYAKSILRDALIGAGGFSVTFTPELAASDLRRARAG